jgi:Ca-activated chloride channel family protein
VAEFGLLMKDSAYKAQADLQSLLTRALANRGDDPFGTSAEFTQIVSLTMLLTQN